MIPEFKRNYNRSYMVLEDEDNRTNYEEKMLLHNNLRGLLMLEIMTSDEKKQYWYDITGRESLKNYLDYERLGFEEMENLLQYLLYAIKETEEYLLNPGHILLTIDGIFFDRNTMVPSFAYFPFEELDFQESMRGLIEELLRLMNHDDTLFVSAMYEIYEKILGENFSVEELLDTLKCKKSKVKVHSDIGGEIVDRALSESEYDKKDAETFDFEKVKKIEHLEFDLEVQKPKSIFSFKKKDKNSNRVKRHQKRREKEEYVMYVEESIPEEKNETVLLSGPFLAEGHTLKYSGSNLQHDVVIKGDSMRIGSAKEQNDIVIDSLAVSKRHARLTMNGANIFLEDLNSTNGTYVNGEALTYQEKRLLKKNDKIHFADEMYVLE